MSTTNSLDVLWDEDTSLTHSEAVTLGAEAFGVAKFAVNVAVWAIAEHHGVQRSVAHAAAVATLVPFL